MTKITNYFLRKHQLVDNQTYWDLIKCLANDDEFGKIQPVNLMQQLTVPNKNLISIINESLTIIDEWLAHKHYLSWQKDVFVKIIVIIKFYSSFLNFSFEIDTDKFVYWRI